MKGKRKVKNLKWPLLFGFQVEGRRTLAKRSEKAANRFLDSVSLFVMDHEPCGRLAGRAYPSTHESTINASHIFPGPAPHAQIEPCRPPDSDR